VWIPVRAAWGYVTGLALFASGTCLLVNKYTRAATTVLGVVLVLLVITMYFPILTAAPADGLVEALNYIGDTTLFAGTVLLAAGAIPERSHVIWLDEESSVVERMDAF
jgi:hypothetical protein